MSASMSNPHPPRKLLRIGELAARTGVSAKALRLYEQRGLLSPCAHSESGYRLYGPEALRRLVRIVVLRRSGFSLAEIAGLLAADGEAMAVLFRGRIAALERELAGTTAALAALRVLAERVGSASDLDLDRLLESIHMGNTLELDLDDAERELVRQRAASIGPERMQQLDGAYPALIAAMRAAKAAGKAATEPEVVALARDYRALAPPLPEVDAATKARLVGALAAREDVMAKHGLDAELLAYVREAMEAAKRAAG
jgi:DNA-binding transcriptional MerR regulator